MKNFLNYISLISSFKIVIERQKEIRKYYNDPDTKKIEFSTDGHWYTLPHDELPLETLLNCPFIYSIRVTFWNECKITFGKIKLK